MNLRGRIAAGYVIMCLLFLVLGILQYVLAVDYCSRLGAADKELAGELAREFIARMRLGTLGMMAVVAVVAGVLGMLGYRALGSFTSVCRDMTTRLKGGDLSIEPPARGSGPETELDVIMRDLGDFSHTMSGRINEMLDAVGEILALVDRLRASADESAGATEEQATQATEIAATSEQMSQTITEIAGTAHSAAEFSVEALDLTLGGREIAEGAVEAVGNVSSVTLGLSDMIERLNDRVREIGEITVVIEEIADQTNLLALNAAIEAARAGDQGRGFAVVADEVRKLAERTMKATGRITGMIGAVQGESRETARFMADATGHVRKARLSIENVGTTLGSIVDLMGQVRDRMSQISVAVEEQSTASEEISRTIEKTAALAGVVNVKSHGVLEKVDLMTAQIDRLRTPFVGLRTHGGERLILSLSKGDHRLWVNRIAAHLSGESPLDMTTLKDHTKCRLGGWYYGDGMKRCGSMQSFRAMEEPHRQIHAMGKRIVELHDSGKQHEARYEFHKMQEVSEQIIALLDRLQAECSTHSRRR